MTDLIPKTLTERERIALFDAERTIDRGLKTFVEVGTALAEIRDGRLYRSGYATFEEYLDQRWQLTRRRAYQLIEAAAGVQNFAHEGIPVPAKESQARELARVPESDRPAVWQQVLDATGGKPTAAAIRAAAQPEPTPDPRMVQDVELPGLGEQYKPDPGERIKDVGDAAPEYVQRADATPETLAGRDPAPARGPVATTGRPDPGLGGALTEAIDKAMAKAMQAKADRDALMAPREVVEAANAATFYVGPMVSIQTACELLLSGVANVDPERAVADLPPHLLPNLDVARQAHAFLTRVVDALDRIGVPA